MARRITIPIANHGEEGICTWEYLVEYKIEGAAGYTFSQMMYDSPIVLDNLLDDTLYDLRITRYCCNSVSSAPYTFQFNTTFLDVPTGFAATPAAGDVTLDWDEMTDADSYRLYRSTNIDYTGSVLIYEGSDNEYEDEGLTAGTYYYRVQSLKANHAASDYATTNATIS